MYSCRYVFGSKYDFGLVLLLLFYFLIYSRETGCLCGVYTYIIPTYIRRGCATDNDDVDDNKILDLLLNPRRAASPTNHLQRRRCDARAETGAP